jgi:hypothetical protein
VTAYRQCLAMILRAGLMATASRSSISLELSYAGRFDESTS